MPGKRHIHKYFKRPLGSGWVWACALDDCSHYWPAHLNHMLEGKRTLCWNHDHPGHIDCSKVTVLDARAWAMEKPVCENCDPNVLLLDSSKMDESTREKLIAMGVIKSTD